MMISRPKGDAFAEPRSCGAVANARCASIIAVLAMLVAASAHADDPPAPPPTSSVPAPPALPKPGPKKSVPAVPAAPAAPEPDPDPNESLIIYVVATTPLHGSRLPKDHVPANVQTISAEDLGDQKSLDLSSYAAEALGSVHINDVQGNPLQSDVQYRGFLASPLLGAPQGLSMYLDGVRLNEPFGDTINWDLIPSNAIRSVNVIPGSNPLFGLNTLGGALSLETKTGFSDPGADATLLYGSWGRKLVRADAGAHSHRFGIFGAAQIFDEDGWRDFSPTRAAHGFVSASYQDAGTTADLSLLGASTSLTGNGPLPEQLLAMDRTAFFTAPDRTENRLFMATLRGEHPLSAHLRLSGTSYLRTNRTPSVNGDRRDWTECMATPGALCSIEDSGNETPVLDKAGMPVVFDSSYDAASNRTDTRQTSYGVAVQLAADAPVAARENHLLVGGDAGQSRIRFRSQTTVGTLGDDRTVSDVGFVDPAAPIAVDSTVNNLGVYATDTFSIYPDLFLTLSGRFNLTQLALDDRIGDALSGDHAFHRINPAAGLSYQPRRYLGAYASYSESNRAPTAVELTCASPADPCRLPNSFLSDPPLAQVVARTVEVGVRGASTPSGLTLSYDLAAFHTVNSSDILFISSGMVANRGYFANVGDTRRQGIEADLTGRKRFDGGTRIDGAVHYTFLDASFETPFTALSEIHPGAVNGIINVPAGAHIPSIPQHVVKVTLSFQSSFGLSAGVNVIYNSGQYLRGDEANLLEPVPGYLVANARVAYRVWSHTSVFLLVNNLFDARDSTFGVLGDATDILGSTYDNPRFLGPGAPRAAWLGVDLND
jgi:outer membrane receptor protein involved in Fe transport